LPVALVGREVRRGEISFVIDKVIHCGEVIGVFNKYAWGGIEDDWIVSRIKLT